MVIVASLYTGSIHDKVPRVHFLRLVFCVLTEVYNTGNDDSKAEGLV